MSDDRAGLHPRHPGRGCSTHLIRLEADNGNPEAGGAAIFLPSGATKMVAWRTATAITPTLEAAKGYTAKVIEQLQADGLYSDIDRTNWASVVAAMQRIILDFNDKLRMAVGAKFAKSFPDDPTRLMH